MNRSETNGDAATMKFPRCFKFLFLLFVLLLMSATGVSAAEQSRADQGPALQNDSLRIHFNGASGAVAAWSVQGQSMSRPRNLASLANEQLRLAGSIANRDIYEWMALAGGWKTVEKTDRSVTFRLAGEALPFVIEQRWTLREETWLAGLEISIRALRAFDTPDLWIVIGPGIGERPSSGLGVSEGLYSFTEVVYQTSGDVYNLRLESAGESRKVQTKEPLEWIGLQSRYFAMLLVPGKQKGGFCGGSAVTPKTAKYFPANPAFETQLNVRFTCGAFAEGEKKVFDWSVYGGGKSYQALKQTHLNLQSLLFAGLWQWMRLLTLGIMHVLYAIQAVVVNWGLAIVCLAFLVRLVIHPIARKAIAAQKRFNELQEKIQPEIREIKSRYKGGEQSERILYVYEQYGISPLAGLKPLLIVLIQLPIFVALFYLLGQAFELRETSFLWMETLAEPDRLFSFGVNLPFFGSYFNLLPLLMTATNLISIKISQPRAEGNGKSFKNSLFLAFVAVAFFLLFYSFPSGMVLYWTMANVLQVIHQVIVERL